MGLGGNTVAHGNHALHGLGANAASVQAAATGAETVAAGAHGASHLATKVAPTVTNLATKAIPGAVSKVLPAASGALVTAAPKLMNVGKVLGTGAAGAQLGVNAYQAGRMVVDPKYRQEAYNTQEAAANRGSLASVAQATGNPAAAVYTAGKLTGDMFNSQADARKSQASLAAAQAGFDARNAQRRQMYPDAQWAAMKPAERGPIMRQLRKQGKNASDDEPSTIGKGLGTLFSDFVPYAPSGARRSGAASLMAERIGTDPGILLKYPMLSQVAAMLGGGALAKPVYDATGSVGGAAATGILPYMLVQAFKRNRIQEIDRDYKTKPRKRLREVGSDDMVEDAMGSHRLGMAQANEAMRTRKYRDIGAIAEAADTLPVATTLMGLGPGMSLPLTQLIDQLESRKFINKQADFSDQISGPAIPMYLAAAGLGTAGLMAAGKKLHNDLNDPNLKNMPRGEWDGLSKHISKRDLLSAEVPGLSNAFFARAKNDAEAQGILRYIALHDPVVRKKISILDPTLKNLRKQVQEHGLIAFDPTFGKASVVGHEAGHGKIEHTPGILQGLQRHLYGLSPVIAPLSAVGGMAAGLATKNTLGGLLAGTGIGLLGGAGMMFPEYMATHHGMQGLKTYKGGKFAQPGDWGRSLTALGTYGALNVLPAALSGAFGGYIGGRRKKRREQAEANLEEPDNVIRMDEDARKFDKAANLAQRFQQIQQLKIQAKALGSDYADKSALKQLGSYLKPSINQFFNNKEVQQLGIKKGMKPTKILDILRNVSGSQS